MVSPHYPIHESVACCLIMLLENGGEKAELKGKWKIVTPLPIKKVILYDKAFEI